MASGQARGNPLIQAPNLPFFEFPMTSISFAKSGLTAFLLATLMLPSLAQAQTLSLQGVEASPIEVSVADLAALPRSSVSLTIHGEGHTFEGPLLASVLGKVDAPLGDRLRGVALRSYVVVRAADGYAVVLSLAEVDPAMRGQAILLADKVDGRPIGDEDGPYRLVVEGDARPARSARQVTSIAIMETQAGMVNSTPH